MPQDIYDPLAEYIQTFHPRFKEVAEKTFDELADEAQVDVEANRETCRKIYTAEGELSSVKTSGTWWKVLCVILWTIVAGAIVWCIAMYDDLSEDNIISIVLIAIVALAILLFKVHPKLKSIHQEKEHLSATIEGLKNEAWKQMSPLNCLYDWDIFTRMM